jgi:uncharacterized protein YbbC (DUF1343 family)
MSLPVPGAYSTSQYFPLIEGKRIGLVVNHTSRIGDVHLVDSLLEANFKVTSIFSPEHGFLGQEADGEKIEDGVYAGNIKIYSLYGQNRKPTAEAMKEVDVMIFDIQDVGARFYTYLSTLHYTMEAAAERDIPFIVLDRPNPNGHYVDGPVMEPENMSFVGLHPVPIVYGMTIGEYAQMINGEGWLKNSISSELTVIKCAGYSHNTRYECPIAPSPNLPNARAIALYPSLCILEGTTFSVGRGTDYQFQIYGHPSYRRGTFEFTPSPNDGSKYPKHDGATCRGVSLISLRVNDILEEGQLNLAYLLDAFHALNGTEIEFYRSGNSFERLWGNGALRGQLERGLTASQIRESWLPKLEHFKTIRAKYLLYN